MSSENFKLETRAHKNRGNVILDALKVIKLGKVYDLSVEINKNLNFNDNLNFFNILNKFTFEGRRKYFKDIERDSKISTTLEVIIGSTHSFTHVDSLCHFQYDNKVHGGYNASDLWNDSEGWINFGANETPIIIGKGLLFDIAKFLKKEKLEDNYTIELDDVIGYMDRYDIEINPGDIVFFRTGKIKDYSNDDYFEKGPGICSEVSEYLYKKGICAAGIDYFSIDPSPFHDFNNSVHIKMLYNYGCYIVESLYLEELSNDNVINFFLVCPPIKIFGSSGSWVRPVAIV